MIIMNRNVLRLLSQKGILLLAIMLFPATLLCQSPGRTNPEDVGLSSERLLRINEKMKDYVENDKLAGIVTLVARKGKIAHFESFGYADIESGKKMEKDAIFRIYSMTKPIVSVGLMMLYEQGEFQLTDPVRG